MIINLLQEAEEELVEAASYYESQQSGLGMEFIIEIRRALRIISESPRLGVIISSSVRKRLVRRFPFAILYEIHDDVINIAAIAHQRRKPNYWKDRVDT